MLNSTPAKIALVHHWLVTPRGGEQVLAAIAELYPQADLFTLVREPGLARALFPGRSIQVSPLQRIPGIRRGYRLCLPWFGWASARLQVEGHALVISSDAATVKSVRAGAEALHVCYCHSPMRYVWSGYDTYRQTGGRLARHLLPVLVERLRRQDFAAAQRVDVFVANSETVRARIRRYYQRESVVIPPPVAVDVFRPAVGGRGGARSPEFLAVSSLVPYKRLDIAIEAFNHNGLPLCIVGEGSERARLQRRARPNIRFLGAVPRPELVTRLQTSRALVFPGEEDFGIIMAEALACGCPVVAYNAGGATEIVRHGVSGLLFAPQSAAGLIGALEALPQYSFREDVLRASVLRFSRVRFQADFARCVEQAWQTHLRSRRPAAAAGA